MLEATNILFINVESSLHAGSGRGVSNVDLPIQRNQVYDYPVVQGSGIKGRLRADTKSFLNNSEWITIFGPDVETGQGAEHAGAISIGEANVLLFPVRSLNGVFALTTCAHVLARFSRDLRLVGGDNVPQWSIPEPELEAGTALVASGSKLSNADKMVLEEFSFSVTEDALVTTVADWLKQYALPSGDEYTYWRNQLAQHLTILADEDFRDFCKFSTEVVTRIRIDEDTGTVKQGALWTEENLPADTLMYAPISASQPRSKNGGGLISGTDVLAKLRQVCPSRTRLGGDESVGRGNVFLRWWEG